LRQLKTEENGTMFLTDKQITDLTGYRNRKRQRDWLDKNGVKYLAGAKL
jgi:hypothetical protein